MKKDKEFQRSEPRPHMEMKDDKRITTSQGVAIPSSNNGKRKGLAPKNFEGNVVVQIPCSLNSRENQIEQLTPIKQKPSRVTASRTKKSRFSPASAYNGISLGKQPTAVDRSANKASWGKKKLKVSGKDKSVSSSMDRSQTETLQVESSQHGVGGKELNAVENTADDVQIEQLKEETERPIVIGLLCAEMENSWSRGSHQSHNKENLTFPSDKKQDYSAMRGINEIKQSETGSTIIQKRKRGRPPKTPIKAPEPPVTGHAQSENVASNVMTVNGSIPSAVDSHRNAEVVVMRMEASIPNEEGIALNENCKKLINGQPKLKNRSGSNKKAFKDSINVCEENSLNRGKMQITNEKTVPELQDSTSRGKTTELNCIMKEVEKVITGIPYNEFEDQPLSKWIEEIQGPSTLDSSRVLPGKSLERCTETSEKQQDTSDSTNRLEKHSGMPDKGAIVPSEKHILPFEKNTVLWETIESMEIFRKAPQKPHFQPLAHVKESLREGLAIGQMVTFSSVVEQASGLQFTDPKSTFDEILEVLAELEGHGFDVMLVRNRISELIAMKDQHEKLLSQVEELNGQIAAHNLEKIKIDEEMGEINKQISKLQEKLSLAESSKESKSSAILSLQSKVQETVENIKSTECDFEGLARRPL